MPEPEPIPHPTARWYPGLLALCILLWIIALLSVVAGVVLVLRGAPLDGILALLVGIVMAAAATGLYQMKRWGVIGFGLLVMVGSINHLAVTLQRYTTLSSASPLGVISALFSILLALLIPILLIYLTLVLWRQAK